MHAMFQIYRQVKWNKIQRIRIQIVSDQTNFGHKRSLSISEDWNKFTLSSTLIIDLSHKNTKTKLFSVHKLYTCIQLSWKKICLSARCFYLQQQTKYVRTTNTTRVTTDLPWWLESTWAIWQKFYGTMLQKVIKCLLKRIIRKPCS